MTPMRRTMELTSRVEDRVLYPEEQVRAPAAVLRACGWLAEGASLVRIRNLSSSHSVHLATRSDGAEAVVKQRKADGSRGLTPEMFVYRMASWIPALDGVLARPLHIDEAAQILVLEALAGARDRAMPRRILDFWRRTGETLAVVHGATLGLAIPMSQAAGVLEVADHPEVTGLGRPPATQALMHRIAADEVIAPSLRLAKENYVSRSLIHGDLRPDHWVAMPDGALRLIDWEMSGGGDPAADFAAAMVEPALDRLRAGSRATVWPADVQDAITDLAEGYRRAGGPIAFDQDASRRHIVHLGAARLLHVACEWADTCELADAMDAAFEQARSLLDSEDSVAAVLAS